MVETVLIKDIFGRSNANTFTEEKMAATREQGSNKINMVDAVLRRKNYLEAVLPNFLLVLFLRSSLKRISSMFLKNMDMLKLLWSKTREQGSNKISYLLFIVDMGHTTTIIGKGRSRGVDRSSGKQGGSQGSVLGSSDTVGLKSDQQHTLMSSSIEGSDGDDVSSCRVASTKRGKCIIIDLGFKTYKHFVLNVYFVMITLVFDVLSGMFYIIVKI